MNNQLLKPVCMVVGRDNANFRHLQRGLGSRAAFFASTESQCLGELVKSGADVVVILWSSTSRQCAQVIHRSYPQAKVILEGNRTSLPGRPEKNGFMSVMEKSQTRTELVRQVEAALDDCESSPDVHLLPESNGLDSGSFIGRLSALPVVSGDTQRTADHLLESFLSAAKSGCGGLFLQEPETGEYVPVSVRNLPYHVHTLRIAPSSKLVPLLAGHSAPQQFSGNAPGTLLSSFVAQLGCNLVLPLMLEGSLHGWFVFLMSEQIGHVEKGILTSMGFFAAETLKQSYATLQAARRTELNQVFLTRVTEALAWVKPGGELDIIHDAQQLIALRETAEPDVFARLASSVLKEAIHKAREGNPGSIRFRQKSTGKMLRGKTSVLADGSVVLNLSTEHEEDASDRLETGRSHLVWTDLALSTLAGHASGIAALPDAAQVEGVVQRIRDMIAHAPGKMEPLASVLESIALLLPRTDVNDPAQAVKEQAVSSGLACGILLLALSLRLTQNAKVALKISLTQQPPSTVRIQLDVPHAGSGSGKGISAPPALEYVALDGTRAEGGSISFADSAFGSRWEVLCPVAPFQANTHQHQATILEMPQPVVLQKALNVLQDGPDPVNQVVDELLHG
jgi:hypothetical protein